MGRLPGNAGQAEKVKDLVGGLPERGLVLTGHSGSQEVAQERGLRAHMLRHHDIVTDCRILRAARLSRARDLDPPLPASRYEHARPGAMIHMDVKKLGRFSGVGHRITGDRATARRILGRGWEFVHIAIDDNSRIAFSKTVPDETRDSAIAFPKQVRTYYRPMRIRIERVMIDNGSCYKASNFAEACRRRGINYVRTKPHTPRTDGKAERFIKTALTEWAHTQPFETSELRAVPQENGSTDKIIIDRSRPSVICRPSSGFRKPGTTC